MVDKYKRFGQVSAHANMVNGAQSHLLTVSASGRDSLTAHFAPPVSQVYASIEFTLEQARKLHADLGAALAFVSENAAPVPLASRGADEPIDLASDVGRMLGMGGK